MTMTMTMTSPTIMRRRRRRIARNTDRGISQTTAKTNMTMVFSISISLLLPILLAAATLLMMMMMMMEQMHGCVTSSTSLALATLVLFPSSFVVVDTVNAFPVTNKYIDNKSTTSMRRMKSSRAIISSPLSMESTPMRSSSSLFMSSANGDIDASPISSAVVSNPSQKQKKQSQQLGPPICFYTEIDVPTFTTTESSQEEEEQGQQQPRQEIVVIDLTSRIQELVKDCQLDAGTVTLISKHTTTSLLINEYEKRLMDDIRDVFLKLIPPDDRSVMGTSNSKNGSGSSDQDTTATVETVRYKHNDIELRPDGEDERLRCVENGWMIDDPTELQKWRNQEPINAHSHLLAMTIGSQSECIPVSEGKLCIGQWQSIMLVDLDAPRQRKVGVHVMGYL